MLLKTWEKRGKSGVLWALSRVMRASSGGGPVPELGRLQSILLIRTQNQLGDMILSTPAFRAVRAAAPEARIDLVASPANIHGVEANLHLDEVILFDKKILKKRPHRARSFIDRLRSARYELAFVLSSVDFSVTSASLAVASGAKWRVGRAGVKEGEKRLAEALYHRVLSPPVPGRHQTLVNLDLVRELGAPEVSGTPELHLTLEERARGSGALERAAGRRGTAKRVLIHPGAGKLPNRWPAERFGEVAARLQAKGHQVVLAAGPSEVSLLDRVDAGGRTRFARLPALSVRELAGAIEAAEFLLCNDTGILHVGSAVGTPLLVLFGPTNPEEWCPRGPAVTFLRAPGGDLTQLETRAVQERILEILAELPVAASAKTCAAATTGEGSHASHGK